MGQTVAGLEMPLRDQGFAVSFAAVSRPPLLRIDKDALGQVLVNLIDNAVKYSGERKEVDVRVEQTGGDVRISVRDRGIGIPYAEQKKIFEKFYRLDPNQTRGVGGTGLGLYVSSELVRRMNGRLWVESREGEGSRFYVDLPLDGNGGPAEVLAHLSP